MKKIVILTSVFALAACSGGHHSHHGNGGVGGTAGATDDVIRGAVTSDAQLSNSKITGMASEILVPTDGVGASITIDGARHSSGKVTHNGKEYDSYKLDDADFNTLSMVEDKENDTAFMGYRNFKFHVDGDGKISAITVTETDLDGKETWKSSEFVRNKDNKFVGELRPGTSYVATLETYGKQVGLRYSDFGIINEQVGENDFAKNEFAGGYDVKKIDRNTVLATNQNMKFSGIAVGSVNTDRTYTEDETVGAKIEGKAILNVDISDGKMTEKLDLLFAKDDTTYDKDKVNSWYDVHIVKNSDKPSDHSVEFTNGDKVPDELKLNGTDKQNVIHNGSQINYYGDNKNPSEFTGAFVYTATDVKGAEVFDDYEDGTFVEMHTTFGGKK